MDSGDASQFIGEVVGGRSLCFYACFLMFGLGSTCFISRSCNPCFQVSTSSSSYIHSVSHSNLIWPNALCIVSFRLQNICPVQSSGPLSDSLHTTVLHLKVSNHNNKTAKIFGLKTTVLNTSVKMTMTSDVGKAKLAFLYFHTYEYTESRSVFRLSDFAGHGYNSAATSAQPVIYKCLYTSPVNLNISQLGTIVPCTS